MTEFEAAAAGWLIVQLNTMRQQPSAEMDSVALMAFKLSAGSFH